MSVQRVLLASPRGYCAGVERAVETVEQALEHYGAPVYVRKQIVHNIHVVRDLEARGAIFVEDERDVPAGATVVYSAHGVAPSVHENSAHARPRRDRRDLPARHEGARPGEPVRRDGYTVLLIGHAGPRGGRRDDGGGARLDDPRPGRRRGGGARPAADAPLAYVTQTTLSVDETGEIIATLRRRFPAIVGPKKEDICYATSNRQWAVKDMLAEIELLLVIGSRNSSNSNRLVDVARAARRRRRTSSTTRRRSTRRGSTASRSSGITSGASAPERLVTRVCDWFRARGIERIEPYRMVDEDVTFRLPVELRRELALADARTE